MKKLDLFLDYLCGRFDNSCQLSKMDDGRKQHFPLAEHINTEVTGRITGLPAGFSSSFVLEESYYTLHGRKTMRPHLMLFTMNSRHQVVLISYETPRHVNQEDFVYSDSFRLDYRELTASHIFTPLVYQYSDGAFQGANESMFAPAVKFATARKIGKDGLVIKETMERNGRKTFGFDEPIMYRRVE